LRAKGNAEFSRAILSELWLNEVMKATVLFLKFYERGSINDAVKSTYLEMHTLYHYENAQGCNGNEGTLPVKVHTAQNFADIKRSDIFQNYYNKNFHKCQIRVHALTVSPFVNLPKRFSNNHSRYQKRYEGGWEIELLGVVQKALNMSLDIEISSFNRVELAIVVTRNFGLYDILQRGRQYNRSFHFGQKFHFLLKTVADNYFTYRVLLDDLSFFISLSCLFIQGWRTTFKFKFSPLFLG